MRLGVVGQLLDTGARARDRGGRRPPDRWHPVGQVRSPTDHRDLLRRRGTAGRVDDPDLAEKMKAEVEGILLWACKGLQRLAANNFKFTESQRTKDNREAVKRDNNNIFDFLESEGYIYSVPGKGSFVAECREAVSLRKTELYARLDGNITELLHVGETADSICAHIKNSQNREVRA